MTDSSNLAETLEPTVDEKIKTVKVSTPKLASVKQVAKSTVVPKLEDAADSPVAKDLKVDEVNKPLVQEKAKPPAKSINKPSPAKKSNVQSRKRPSRREVIERQANPKSKFAGQQKTILLGFEYRSDILHEYLQMNQATMLSAYERLAALLRMVSNDKPSIDHVTAWINQNVTICSEQVKELQAQREAIIADSGFEDINLIINVPDNYKTTFEASHPIAHKMLAILRLVDNELNKSEELFLAGIIEDESYGKFRNQSTTVIRGSVDRIFKATSPGIRNGGRFAPEQLARWIRDGNKLLFADLPQQFEHLVELGA
jgi:hypothetical protein